MWKDSSARIPLTRWKIYEVARKLGVLTAEQIAERELIEMAPGAVAPEPLPTPIPLRESA